MEKCVPLSSEGEPPVGAADQNECHLAKGHAVAERARPFEPSVAPLTGLDGSARRVVRRRDLVAESTAEEENFMLTAEIALEVFLFSFRLWVGGC